LSVPLIEILNSQEKGIIEAALVAFGGKVAGSNGVVARPGIPRSTLDSKIKQVKIRKYKCTPEPQ